MREYFVGRVLSEHLNRRLPTLSACDAHRLGKPNKPWRRQRVVSPPLRFASPRLPRLPTPAPNSWYGGESFSMIHYLIGPWEALGFAGIYKGLPGSRVCQHREGGCRRGGHFRIPSGRARPTGTVAPRAVPAPPRPVRSDWHTKCLERKTARGP